MTTDLYDEDGLPPLKPRPSTRWHAPLWLLLPGLLFSCGTIMKPLLGHIVAPGEYLQFQQVM